MIRRFGTYRKGRKERWLSVLNHKTPKMVKTDSADIIRIIKLRGMK
jgi:hypothetical protein